MPTAHEDNHGMTVGQLKKLLAAIPDDHLVILQKDAEGNGYSPLADVEGRNNVYVPDSTWSGEVYYKKLTGALRSLGYTEEDVYPDDDGIDCVVLAPVN